MERNGPSFEFEGAEFIEVQVERISVICPLEQCVKVMKKLHREGWRTQRSGPKRESDYRLSETEAHITAERTGPVLNKRFKQHSGNVMHVRRSLWL